MTRLYEWCVVTGTGSRRKVSPIGLAGAEHQAVGRMLRALRAVPAGTAARGWVTAMIYLPGVCCYERYEIRAEAERWQDGTLHMAIGGTLCCAPADDAKLRAAVAEVPAGPPTNADEWPGEPQARQALRPGTGQG